MTTKPFFEIGQTVERRYELRRVIGTGAEGVVYEAFHRFLRRPVALKTINCIGSPQMLERRRQRIVREARVLSELRHPGIVEVLDAGVTVDNQPYVAMELLQGKTLEALITARERLSVADALAVVLDLCETVAAAHRRGVLHRDIKPSNVFVVRSHGSVERTKLLDFGTSKSQPHEDAKLTEEGAIVGTPAYMSPEQLMAQSDLDPRTDQYSLGALLFECLTGRVVYPGNYPTVLRAVHSQGPVPPMNVPGVPPELESIVAKAIAKDRTQRFACVEDLADALRPFLPAGAKIQLLQARTPNQRRRHERAPFLAPVSLRRPEGALDGRCEDISESGMLLICRQECVADRTYEVRFGAPISGRIATTDARVRWVRARPAGGFAVGLEFVDPADSLVDDIAHFVRLMSDASPITSETEPSHALGEASKATLADSPAARRRFVEAAH